MKKTLLLIGCFVALIAMADVIDHSGRTERYRSGSILKFDTTSSIADEDANWTITATQLKSLSSISAAAGAVTISGTTNQIVFGGTNAAPASTTLIKWVSVQISGDTNIYRLGLAL